MRYARLIGGLLILASATTGWAEQGFDEKYERDYNIFNPVNGAITETAMGFLRWQHSRYCSTEPAVHTKCGMDAPLNPTNAYSPDNPFNSITRYDPNNPTNPINQFNPNNPFNPINRYRPENPLNLINKYNSSLPFAPLDGGRGSKK